MKKPNLAFCLAGTAAVSLSVVLLLIGFYSFNSFTKKLVYEQLFTSVHYIEALRQYSEDLSRAAIIYAITGDSDARKKYYNILNINDKLVTPRNFSSQDFTSDQDGSLKNNSLNIFMTKEGFSPEESAKLELAQNLIRDTIPIELAAMENVGRGSSLWETSLKALSMLTDGSYLATKAQILNLINETQLMLSKRTRLAEEKSLKQTEGLIFLLLFAIATFAASSTALFWLERRRSSDLEKGFYHDPLTKLANRAYLDAYLKRVTTKARAQEEIVVLAFLDLNGFKAINDIFGHARGDTVLKNVAKCLLAYVREKDLVARYGGDEFVVVFVAPAAHRDQTLARLKKALRSSFKQLARDAENIKVTAAVGISIYPQPAPSLAALLRTADQAMYAAKGYDTPLAVSEYAPKEILGSKIKEPRHHPPKPQREDEQSTQVQQETRTQHLRQRHVATPIDDGIRRGGDGQHESTTAR
jgi:diguanylate cyclase (GGDEF)-like protein